MGMPAVSAAPANVARTSFAGNHEAFVAAVQRIGGAEVLADRTDLAVEYINDILAQGLQIDAADCPQIERATRTPCEELRAELIWHRDGAGEVIGYSSPVEHHERSVMVAALSTTPRQQGLIDGKWDALSYRAGIMHGLPTEECSRLLDGSYAAVADWSDSRHLDSLQSDCDIYRSSGVYDCCYGMLWDFDDATRDGLLDRFKPSVTREWGQGKYDALWAEAQAIRASAPFKSEAALRAYLAGMASVVGVHGDGADFVDFFTAGERIALSDAADMARAAEYAVGLILDAALKPAREDAAAWGNLVAGSTHQVHGQIGSQTAERIGRTAANLLDLMLPGLEAIHDYQFTVMSNGKDDCLDAKSPVSLCAFQMIMQQLTQQLVVLRENMLTRQRELQA